MDTPDASSDAINRMLERLRATRPGLATRLEGVAADPPARWLDEKATDVPDRIEPRFVDGRPLPIFILGCGRGLVATAIRKGLRDHRTDILVTIVESDPPRLLATLAVDEWSDVLEDDRFRFAVGADVRTAVSDALPEHPHAMMEVGLRPGVALVPGDAPDRVEGIRSAFLHAAESELASVAAECEAQARTRGLASSDTASLPEGPWRILSVVHARTTALRHLGPAIVGAADRAGHAGTVHVLDRDGAPFTRSLATIAALRSDADLVVGFLEPGARAIPWRDDYPSLVLVSSNPALLPIDEYPWSGRDLVVVTEPDFATPYRRLGLEPLIRPLATPIHPLDRIESDMRSSDECDVLVVGTLPPSVEQRTDLTPETRALVASLAADWVRRPDAGIADWSDELGERTDPGDWGPLGLALAYEATRRRRIETTIALADAGLDLQVRGDDAWVAALAGSTAASCYRGWLPDGVPAAAAYRSAKVVVNVNSFATPGSLNMRSFAVPAAGGVLVCDDRPALHEAFEDGREVVSFRSPQTLPTIVADLVGDRRIREEISGRGRTRAARDHSWDGWWTWAERALRDRFPAG